MDISNRSLLKDKCYINGEWIDSDNKETIEVNNPSSLEIVANVPKCGRNETKFAISKASDAWDEWKKKTSYRKISSSS